MFCQSLKKKFFKFLKSYNKFRLWNILSFCCFFKVKATADISTVAGQGSSSVHVKADGKDRVKLDAQMSHILQRGERAVALMVNVSQSLLPTATDLHVNMTANMSSHRCVQPPF